MRKKFLSMLLATTMIVGLFTGCGSIGSANTITVSEMLNHILEEEGEVVIYNFTKDGSDWDSDYKPGVNTKAMVYYYNGETVSAMRSSDKKLGGYLDGTAEINIPGTAIQNVEVELFP